MDPILDTKYTNPVYDISNSGHVCHHKQWFVHDPPRYEWMPILNQRKEVRVGKNGIKEDIVGVSGTALIPPNLSADFPISPNDVPFLHPFGFDFEFFIAPDRRYDSLLAPANENKGHTDPKSGYGEALRHANQDLNLKVAGVLGVEIEQDLVPAPYRLNDGDRVVTFGRWIVDCGHDDFHTEIHPPLLLVSARSLSNEQTTSTVIGRAFLVSQEFNEGTLRGHLIKEIAKLIGAPGACKTWGIPWPPGIPCSLQIEAHPQIRAPFSGTQAMTFYLRPPSPRQSSSDQLLVRFYLKARTGVAVRLSDAGSDTVQVDIVMFDQNYKQPKLPKKKSVKWKIGDIVAMVEPAFGAILNIIFPFGATIKTDRYALPPAPGISDGQLVAIPVDSLPASTPFMRDDKQTYPIFGRIDLQWNRNQTPIM